MLRAAYRVDRAPGGNRTRVPRFAGACLATWRPVRSSGARTRTSIAGAKGQRPAIGRHLSIFVEPSLGVEPSPLAYQASVPRRGHRDGDVEIVERTGIEPAAAALQVQLAPLAHASPYAVPTRIELAYRGRQPRILTRGFRDQRARFGRARECWVYGGNRTLATRFTNSRATITLRTPCRGRNRVASQGIEPCACSV